MAKKENEKVELKKIQIMIGDKEISLSVEQARELKLVLSDLLGESNGEKIYIPVPYIPYPFSYWRVTYGGFFGDTSTSTYTLPSTSSGTYTITLAG